MKKHSVTICIICIFLSLCIFSVILISLLSPKPKMFSNEQEAFEYFHACFDEINHKYDVTFEPYLEEPAWLWGDITLDNGETLSLVFGCFEDGADVSFSIFLCSRGYPTYEEVDFDLESYSDVYDMGAYLCDNIFSASKIKKGIEETKARVSSRITADSVDLVIRETIWLKPLFSPPKNWGSASYEVYQDEGKWYACIEISSDLYCKG